jgi:hypothetical protein
MRTAINILLLSIIFLNNSLSQEQAWIINGQFENMTIKEVPVNKLYNVDKNFKALEVFGVPLKVDSIDKSAEPLWIFYYPDFTLTYIQLFPTGPELLQIEVSDTEANFTYQDNNLFRSDPQSLKSSFNTFELKSIDKKLSEKEKFGNTHEYLEYHFKGDKIRKLIYKIDTNL